MHELKAETLANWLTEKTNAITTEIKSISQLNGGASMYTWEITASFEGGLLEGASRLILREAARKVDEDTSDKTKSAAMAKRFVTDAGFNIVNEALQIHGGYGYLKDYPLERNLRDLRVHQILEGTNEIMRVIIAREILKENK